MAAPGDEYSTATPKGMKRRRETECRGTVCAKWAPGWSSDLQWQESTRLRQPCKKGAGGINVFPPPLPSPPGVSHWLYPTGSQRRWEPQRHGPHGPAPWHKAGDHRVDSVSGGVDKSHQQEMQPPSDHVWDEKAGKYQPKSFLLKRRYYSPQK